MKVIVLAGGEGTRLWPMSREDFPKQFLKFGSGPSLLQRTVLRLLKADFVEEILISTNEHYVDLVRKQLQKFGDKVRILIEPLRKNTAPALGLAIKYLEKECGAKKSDPILVVPSDHLIEPEIIFLQGLEQAKELVSKNKIITFGIRPTKAETGYGYIEIGKKFNTFAFETVRFVEKPDLQTALDYLANPHFFWNSGMFLFSIQTFWDELARNAPTLSALFKKDLETVINNFSEMPNLSIDYAIMEKSKAILLYPLAVSWSDVGSWDSVYETMEKDQNQNVTTGKVIAIDTKNSLIIGGKRVISTIGLEDMLIVETADAVFISKKGESQRVKELIEELKIKDLKK